MAAKALLPSCQTLTLSNFPEASHGKSTARSRMAHAVQREEGGRERRRTEGGIRREEQVRQVYRERTKLIISGFYNGA